MKPQEIIIKSNGHNEEKAFVNQFRIMEFSTTSRDTLHTKDTTYKTVIMPGFG